MPPWQLSSLLPPWLAHWRLARYVPTLHSVSTSIAIHLIEAAFITNSPPGDALVAGAVRSYLHSVYISIAIRVIEAAFITTSPSGEVLAFLPCTRCP